MMPNALYIEEKVITNGYEADFFGIVRSLADGDSNPLAEQLFGVAKIEDVERYKWPDANEFNYVYMEEEFESHQDFFIGGYQSAPLFHTYYKLVGFEQSLMLFAADKKLAKTIL